MNFRKLLTVFAALLFSGGAAAANFSFQGMFNQDDNVQLFNFEVGASSNVTLRSLSYAGGVNAAGQTIARGGFDTILALFDSSGTLINSNDDGEENVAADSGTGQRWDAFLETALNPGNYSVSIMQFDNFANGPNLTNGFFREGEGNFTAEFGCGAAAFCDISGVSPFDQRSNQWAFDILNVNSAAEPGPISAIPEPGTYGMLLAGLGLMGFAVRRRQTRNAA